MQSTVLNGQGHAGCQGNGQRRRSSADDTPPPWELKLPQVSKIERCLLGGLLRDNEVIADVVPILTPETFYVDAHQRIYRAIVDLWDHPAPVDLIGLANLLQQRDDLANVGGYAALAEIWDSAVTGANAVYHAGLVRDQWTLRSLIQAGNEIVRDAYDPTGPAAELLDQAQAKVMRLAETVVAGGAVPLRDALYEACNWIDARHRRRGGVSGIPTGFIDLDETLAGLQDSELVIVAARPSCGKTSFGMALAANAAMHHNLPVLFISLEQSRVELTVRLLSSEARVDGHIIRSGCLRADDSRRLVDAQNRLDSAPLYIDDTPGQSVLRIAATARRLKRKTGLRMVVVDYLQLVEPENRRDPRHEQVGSVSRRLKRLARELKVPVVALAQLNRNPENRVDNKPRLADLRESGSIEMDADTVMLLHRPEERDSTIEVIVAKQRNGPIGEYNLIFDKRYTRFENYAGGAP